ncbi:putative PurR-regulated permease PerM [Kribbella rubisoli]|uniref:PurR-regulated permease PerM n=2 Tax=Kribbella rubisoli TaxID=3075929 RepID=A0A4Q7VZG3_9ACTN|nr:putative PurR-regulated permease PerM [Kribbella rubisoli]
MVTEPGDGTADHRPGRPDRSEPAEAAQAQTGSTSMSGPEPAPAPARPAWSQVWPPWTYWVRTTLAVVATLLVVAAARRISHVLLLALVAFVLAIGLDPAVQWLGKLRIRRGWAVAIIFVGLVVFLALFVALLIPLLAREVPQFAAALPGFLADLQRRDDWLGNAFRHASVSAEVRQFIADLPSKIGKSFTAIVGAAGTAFGRVFDVFTVGILCIYFMVALPRLPATIAKLVSRDRRAHVNLLLQRSFDKIGGYVSGNLITSTVCAAATVVALLALRIDYAVPLGLWAGVADLIPQVGAYLGAVPAVLVALTEGPAYSVATVVFFIAYQLFENYLLAPRVYKSSIDLSPAAVIISTLAGGILAGFAGALLALPIAATIKVIAVDVVLASRSNAPPEDPANDGPAAPHDN